MPYITDINADGDLNTALANFNTVCATNALLLGLSLPNLAEIASAATTFNTDLNLLTAAKASASAAKATKDTQKTTSKAVVSKWAKVFRANAAITDTLLAQLQLPAHKTPGTKTPPSMPTMLIASADGLGNVSLNWNRNGNRSGTTFLIEYRLSASDAWALLNSTTRVRFNVQATPGSYIAFRVLAKRSSMSSAPSTPVVLWDGSGPVALSIAA